MTAVRHFRFVGENRWTAYEVPFMVDISPESFVMIRIVLFKL